MFWLDAIGLILLGAALATWLYALPMIATEADERIKKLIRKEVNEKNKATYS